MTRTPCRTYSAVVPKKSYIPAIHHYLCTEWSYSRLGEAFFAFWLSREVSHCDWFARQVADKVSCIYFWTWRCINYRICGYTLCKNLTFCGYSNAVQPKDVKGILKDLLPAWLKQLAWPGLLNGRGNNSSLSAQCTDNCCPHYKKWYVWVAVGVVRSEVKGCHCWEYSGRICTEMILPFESGWDLTWMYGFYGVFFIESLKHLVKNVYFNVLF